jgi:HEAT repeat protein
MRLPIGWLGACLLAAASAAAAQEPEPQSRFDAVDHLAQTLRAPVGARAARDAQLRAAIERLRGPDELLRALQLSGWRNHDLDEELANIDARHRGAIADHFMEAVRGALRRDDPEARKTALKMVGSLDVKLVGKEGEPLARAFTADVATLTHSGPTVVRELAARTLGRINADPVAAAAALDVLLKDGDPHLRAAAGEALVALVATALRLDPSHVGGVGGHEDAVRAACAAVPVASAGLADASVEVRRHCAEALTGAAEALAALVSDTAAADEVEDWTGYQHAIEQERTVLQPLAAALRGRCGELARAGGDGDVQVRVLARHAVESIAAARVGMLRRASSAVAAPDGVGDTASARRSAAYLLEDPLLGGLREALPALVAGIGDADVKGRRASIDALEVMGRQAVSAAPALVGALSDRDRFVRWAAARALGQVRPANAEAVVVPLARLLTDPDDDLRLAAAASLGAYGSAARAALPALVEAAQSREPELRVAAMRALESIGSDDTAALSVLNAALGDSDGRVRQAAAEALQKVNAPRREAVDALLRPSQR